MSTPTGVVRKFVAGAMLVLLLALHARVAEAQSPTDAIAECIAGAWDEYLECIDDVPWYAELLCPARFHSDVILCLPKEILGKIK